MALNLSILRDRTTKWYVAVPLFLLVAILFGVLLRNNATELSRLRAEEQLLATQKTQVAEEERSLRLQLSSVSSGSSVASAARAMSFVTPDEVCYEILDA